MLHACFESRQIALEIYDVSIGTETHPAAIPFDFKRDCLMLDDWLAASNPDLHKRSNKLEVFELSAPSTPVGRAFFAKIQRIAAKNSFLLHTNLAKAVYQMVGQLVWLCPKLDYLVFYTEEDRNPYAKGPIIIPSSTQDSPTRTFRQNSDRNTFNNQRGRHNI